ncbi:hypothetical protein ACFX12_029675 [Malus domestica]
MSGIKKFQPTEQNRFEVFDRYIQWWKHIPNPPCYEGGGTTYNVLNYFAKGHRLVICTKSGSYFFDTHKEKWEDANNLKAYEIKFPWYSPSGILVDVGGFLIAWIKGSQELVAYHLDSYGIPNSCQMLPELKEMFNNYLLTDNCFLLGECGEGDRKCFVFFGRDCMPTAYVHALVFRVKISNSVAGKPAMQILRLWRNIVASCLVVQKLNQISSCIAI